MNYWDASAIVALLAGEAAAKRYRPFGAERIVTWWATPVECVSAIARREREGSAPEVVAESYRRLSAIELGWLQIHPSDRLRRSAIRFLKAHPLRAADALHLAAAMIASHFEPQLVHFLTEDTRLRKVAEKEGFLAG